MTIYDIEVQKPNGESYKLDTYQGQPMLIVNTASECGFTPQYEG
ncbi:MAG: glutathione peroxidase, partial [Staphylococcus equorum]|nr:glutathione peroxidase [Staphylococcus equorum]